MSELDRLSLDSSLSRLALLPGVIAVGDWEPTRTVDVWSLGISIRLSTAPAVKDVAPETDWLVVVDFTTDVWGKVKIYPGSGPDDVATTFPHQQFNGAEHKSLPCRTGYICTDLPTFELAASRNAKLSEPVDTLGRIIWHVERCVKWVEAAAADTLTAPGDKFELPDFNTGETVPSMVGYQETPSSFLLWQTQPRAGIVEITSSTTGVSVAQRFLDKKAREVVYQPQWGTVVESQPVTHGIWIRLDAVPVTGSWQAPSTFRELVDSCNRQGIDLVNEIAPTLTAFFSKPGIYQLGCVLLVGMPAAETIGELAKQYHWQAMEIIPVQKLPPGKNPAANNRAVESLLLNRLKSTSTVKWFSKSENWASVELLKRGSVSRQLSKAKVMLIGAGALGSALAVQLVRMGVEELAVLDGDLLESGNLVRHQLGVDSLNLPKATQLAFALSLSNPSARIIGFPAQFPSNRAEVVDYLKECTLIIDCSAEDSVLKGVSENLADYAIPVISCSLGLHAKRLFFYAAATDWFSWPDFDQWFHPFRQQENALLEAAELPQGIGCWHPLFPAPFNRVEGLAAVALEYIDQIYQQSPFPSPIQTCYNWPDLTLGA